MNESWLKGKWTELKGKAQQEWGELTNDDLDQIEGRQDQLIGRIQQRYGIARAEAQEQVRKWEKRHGLR
ncbi:MAG: CsbD family protein [Acidobacteria bacterium]|nr:MAG: CsbD family protein [Acidobacteriota bacterium]REK07864.1 MAG: CsbD family protein [Acidobacteriota bacterium]